MQRQGSACAICGIEFKEPGHAHIDHDHSCCPGKRSCGKCVRGLLCGGCNNGLGRFKDDVNVLQAAIEYLRRFSEQSMHYAG
ncbi:endonuclease domain-containing protein [Streptomyces asiaticus]